MKIKIRYIEENKGTSIIKNKNYIVIYILGIRIKKIIIDRDIKVIYKTKPKNNPIEPGMEPADSGKGQSGSVGPHPFPRGSRRRCAGAAQSGQGESHGPS